MPSTVRIKKSYFNDEDKARNFNWLSRVIQLVQKLLVSNFLTIANDGNYYNAFLFGKDIGIFQIKPKTSQNVPMAHSQVRTAWQRCGVAMKSYDLIATDLEKAGHRLIENPDQGFVRPASRELWKKRKQLGKC